MEKLSLKLGEDLAALDEKMRARNDKINDRAFTDEEQADFDADLQKRELLIKQIDQAKSREAAMKAIEDAKLERAGTTVPEMLAGGNIADQGEAAEIEKIRKRWSFSKFLVSQLRMNSFPFDGVEKEMHEVAVREAGKVGVNIEGFGIPRMLLAHSQRTVHRDRQMMRALNGDMQSGKVNVGEMVRRYSRDNTAGTPTASGYTIQTDVTQIVDYLWPMLQTVSLGAREFTGLQGNILFPTGDARATASWKGEIETSDKTTPTLTNPSMTPHRLPTYMGLSKQLMIQSVQNPSIEAFYADELRRAIRTAVDAAAIAGDGAANVPDGILSGNRTGVNYAVAGDPDGGAIDWSLVLKLEQLVAEADADIGTLAYLTTPGVRRVLKETFKDTPGSGGFPVWETRGEGRGDGVVNGYRSAVSTQMPSDGSKGAGTNLHSIIYGVWSELIIGNWGGMDFLLDPFTGSKEGLVNLVVNSFWDIHVLHEPSFAAATDIELGA